MCFAIFGKKFRNPKNGRHFWGFSKIFAKIGKTQICFYLLRYPVRDRVISAKSLYLARLRRIEANLQSLPFLAKNFRKFPKMAAIFGDFRKFFAKIGKYY